jgi:hypothetical protein
MRTMSLAAAAAAAASIALAVPAQADSIRNVTLPGIAGCEVNTRNVACEGNWRQAAVTPCAECPRVLHMDQAVVDANGNLTWRDADIGHLDPDGPFVLEVGQPYRGYGWTAQTDGSGHCTFTNDATGHGMTVTWVSARSARHADVRTF